MEKTIRIVIETKNLRFGYEKKVVKPDPKKPIELKPIKGGNIDIRV